MDSSDLTQCLRMLNAADHLLVERGEWLLSAHLQAVIEPIRNQLVGLDGADFMGAAVRKQIDGSTAPLDR